MTEIGRIRGVVVGQYGTPISLTVVNRLGAAVDISSYSNLTVTLRDEYDIKTVQYSGSFVIDGSDGRLLFTPSDGDIDRDGEWTGQVKLMGSGLVDYTQTFKLIVERNLG